MKVRCISDNWISKIVTEGAIYEVLEILEDCYIVKSDLGEKVTVHNSRFELVGVDLTMKQPDCKCKVVEKKMDQVKVVRKLEDLDGLENGMGAIAVYDEVNKRVRIRTKEECLGIGITHSDEYSDLDGFLTVMKATGFKFKYKPLRTVEDVRTEMSLKCKEFEFNGDNYCLNYVKLYNRYHTHQDCFNNILGALYFDKETADKYCNELNEILKNK